MKQTNKISTIGLGLSLGLAWALGVLIVGLMALMMDQTVVEPFRFLFNFVYPGWGRNIEYTLLMSLWSFSHGFVGGFLIGNFYNSFSKKFN